MSREGEKQSQGFSLCISLSMVSLWTGCCLPLKSAAPIRWSAPHDGSLLLGSSTGPCPLLACLGVVLAILLALGYCTVSCVFSTPRSEFVNSSFIKISPAYHDVCVCVCVCLIWFFFSTLTDIPVQIGKNAQCPSRKG